MPTTEKLYKSVTFVQSQCSCCFLLWCFYALCVRHAGFSRGFISRCAALFTCIDRKTFSDCVALATFFLSLRSWHLKVQSAALLGILRDTFYKMNQTETWRGWMSQQSTAAASDWWGGGGTGHTQLIVNGPTAEKIANAFSLQWHQRKTANS